jgi:hypothetical protein
MQLPCARVLFSLAIFFGASFFLGRSPAGKAGRGGLSAQTFLLLKKVTAAIPNACAGQSPATFSKPM